MLGAVIDHGLACQLRRGVGPAYEEALRGTFLDEGWLGAALAADLQHPAAFMFYELGMNVGRETLTDAVAYRLTRCSLILSSLAKLEQPSEAATWLRKLLPWILPRPCKGNLELSLRGYLSP